MSCEDPIDRLDAGPRVGAACARVDALLGAAVAFGRATLARAGAALARAGAAFARADVAFARAGTAFARAGAVFAREGAALARAAFARAGAALARAGAAFARVGVAFARAGIALARDDVAFARAGAALRVPVALALAPVARAAGADLAGLFRAAVVFFAALDLRVAEARPAGPVLRRAAPPRPSARMVRASVFTSSGFRSAEIPETPRRRSWPRMSSTFIREISDSDTVGVFGVWLPVCRFVRVAVVPRPELLR
ncbi:hypothetical protein O7598_02060 [Micromonospora sp. WMMC241]|uniref:hypothetical protein n=1 Tax=Micromonospora sp. WMMC241 TaxID=3015159 RepID=UPI0022B6E7A2|nr:hypothetical protein [Micromonospora sp. WMMC241]MCZ7435168.1 hypothetical protein [Micromonospora sp. WMMC241]